MALPLQGLKVTGAARTRANGEAPKRRRSAASGGRLVRRRNMVELYVLGLESKDVSPVCVRAFDR